MVSCAAVAHYIDVIGLRRLRSQLAGRQPWQPIQGSAERGAHLPHNEAMHADGYVCRRGQELLLRGPAGDGGDATQHAALLVGQVQNHYQQAARAAAAPGAAAAVIDPSDVEVAEAAVEAGAAVEDTAVAAVEAPHAAFTAAERELLASAAACGCSSADLLDCVVCGPAYHLQGYAAHVAEVAATEGSRGSRAAEPQVMSDGTMPGLEPSLAQQRRAQQGGFDVSEEYQAAEAADYAAQAAAAESDEAAPTVSAPSAAVDQAEEEPQGLTSAARAARLRRLDQRHDEAPGA